VRFRRRNGHYVGSKTLLEYYYPKYTFESEAECKAVLWLLTSEGLKEMNELLEEQSRDSIAAAKPSF
jgi:hypothetical protein